MQGIGACEKSGKPVINFLQVVEELPCQEKFHSLCMIVGAESAAMVESSRKANFGLMLARLV